MPMVSQCTRLKTEEDAARRKRDAQFPMTASEFRVIRSKDMQVRIARFLLADKMTQERMMTEFGWVYRQINPLLNEYRADVSHPKASFT